MSSVNENLRIVTIKEILSKKTHNSQLSKTV
jgi:hypothetical protein